MTNRFRNVTAAELIKLHTLPSVPGTIGGTLLGVTGLAIVFSTVARQPNGEPGRIAELTFATHTGLEAIGYGQIGLILLGVLAAATEYSGRQIGTTVASVPDRRLLMVGKIIAHLASAAVTAVLAVAAIIAATLITIGEWRASISVSHLEANIGLLLGAAMYLVLISSLAYAVALLTRSVLGALVVMLALVFVASPILSTVTTLAGYLPDRAGEQMYQAVPLGEGTVTAVQGGVLMSAWVALTLALATIAFIRRDA